MKDTYEIDPAIQADLEELDRLYGHLPPFTRDRQSADYQYTKVSNLRALRDHLPILTEQRIWTNWKRVITGTATKKPPIDTNKAKPATWRKYQPCGQSVIDGHADGLGIYIPKGWVCIDIDHISMSQETRCQGAFKRMCSMAKDAGLYIEWSQSGTGLHILGRLPDDLPFPIWHKKSQHANCETEVLCPAQIGTDGKHKSPYAVYLTGDVYSIDIAYDVAGESETGWTSFDEVAVIPVEIIRWAMGMNNEEPSDITSVLDRTGTGEADGRADLRDDLATLDTIDREQRPVKSTVSTCASEPKPYAHDIPRHAHNGPYMPTDDEVMAVLATMCPDMFAVYNGNLGADASSEIFKLCTKLLYLANNDTSKVGSILRGAYAVVDHSNTKHAGQRYPEGDWLEHTLHAALQMRLSQGAKSYEWHKPYEGYSQDTQTDYRQSDTASIDNQYTDRVDFNQHRERGAEVWAEGELSQPVSDCVKKLNEARAGKPGGYLDFGSAYTALSADDKTSLYLHAMEHKASGGARGGGLGLSPLMWEHILQAGILPPESDAFYFDELEDDDFIEQPLPFLNNTEHPFFLKYTSHLLAGAPRAGKSELLYQVLAGWAGHFKRIIIWSEERKSIWKQRRDNYKAAGIDIRHWKIFIHPSDAEKEAVQNSIERDDLLVIDTLRNIMHCKDENSASESVVAIQPVLVATKDCTIVALHHGRKNTSGSIVDKIAGTGNIPGQFDRVLYLNSRTASGGYQKLESDVRGKPVRPVNIRWDATGKMVVSDWQPPKDDGNDGVSGNVTSTAKPKGKMAMMSDMVMDILAQAKLCTNEVMTTKQIFFEIQQRDSEAKESSFKTVIKRLSDKGTIVKYDKPDKAGKLNCWELPELAQCHECDAGTTCTEATGAVTD